MTKPTRTNEQEIMKNPPSPPPPVVVTGKGGKHDGWEEEEKNNLIDGKNKFPESVLLTGCLTKNSVTNLYCSFFLIIIC